MWKDLINSEYIRISNSKNLLLKPLAVQGSYIIIILIRKLNYIKNQSNQWDFMLVLKI